MRTALISTFLALGAAALALSTLPGNRSVAAQPATASLDGTWELVAVLEDGQLATQDDVHSKLVKDGKIVINGSLARFTKPDGADRMFPFVTDATANPKTLDLVGAEKIGTHGIYMYDGDSLIICLKESETSGRPTTFSAAAGTENVLLTLRRVGAAPRLEAPVAAPAVVAAKPVPVEADVRKSLVGRWGHQNDDVIKYVTVNEDGTFSEVTKYKKGFKKLFDNSDRSSGTWKLEGGKVVYTYTASTEKKKQGQIHSLRIISVSTGEMIYIDESGSRRVEWKLSS